MKWVINMYMPMEQEIRGYLVTGSCLVIIVSLILLIYWLIKYKKKYHLIYCTLLNTCFKFIPFDKPSNWT